MDQELKMYNSLEGNPMHDFQAQSYGDASRIRSYVTPCFPSTKLWGRIPSYVTPCFPSTKLWGRIRSYVTPCFPSTKLWGRICSYIAPCFPSTRLWGCKRFLQLLNNCTLSRQVSWKNVFVVVCLQVAVAVLHID